MKRKLNDARFVFTALQGLSVIAMAGGLVLSRLLNVVLALALMLLRGEAVQSMPEGMACMVLLTAGWMILWTAFLRMCGRLKKESSAFTAANARGLAWIAAGSALCGATLTALMLLGYGDMTSPIVNGSFSVMTLMISLMDFVLPAAFLLVSCAALALRSLLLRAMKLQQEADLTI